MPLATSTCHCTASTSGRQHLTVIGRSHLHSYSPVPDAAKPCCRLCVITGLWITSCKKALQCKDIWMIETPWISFCVQQMLAMQLPSKPCLILPRYHSSNGSLHLCSRQAASFCVSWEPVTKPTPAQECPYSQTHSYGSTKCAEDTPTVANN